MMIFEDENGNEKLNLTEYVDDMYLGYAVSTLKDRAIPYLMDGQKPVQRRILYAMKELGLNKSDKKPVKSARVVGEVLGKYHPHGDTAAYDAMVRMAQDFSLRYPLVLGQGNFGSMDGDNQAAMRYTEAKLTPISNLLLEEINMGTTDWKANYDGSIKEPELLPSRLNFMLLNGATGIAVGMSTDIPSHNIRNVADATVATIKNPKISIEEIVEYLQGPDYPNGGQIIDSKERIIENYTKGNGTFRVRCRWHVEKMARGQWQIVVTELPPNMSTRKVLEKIDNVINPTPQKDKNGKTKPLNKSKLEQKNFLLNLISKVSDDSGREESVKIVIDPKSSRQDPEETMNRLIPLLDLEVSVKINLVAVGNDFLPKTKNIKDIIEEWIHFRLLTITRRTNWRLTNINKRLHILEGRVIAFNNIKEVIRIIQEEENPKESLMEKFTLTEIQAEDILEIKLRQLAKLEKTKLENEISELEKEKEKLEKLLSSKTKMNNLMIKELEEDTKNHEDERRTLIKEESVIKQSQEDIIQEEDVTVIYTKNGWIIQRKGHEIDLSTINFKIDDEPLYILEGKNTQEILLYANNGRGYSIKNKEIPSGKNNFIHINTLIDLPSNKEILNVFLSEEKRKIIVSNNNGYGYISELNNLIAKNKAGKTFATVLEGETLFPLILIENDKDLISILTEEGKLLIFNINEIKELPKGKGVQLAKMKNSVNVKDIGYGNSESIEVTKGKKLQGEELESYLSKRALRGKNFN